MNLTKADDNSNVRGSKKVTKTVTFVVGDGKYKAHAKACVSKKDQIDENQQRIVASTKI